MPGGGWPLVRLTDDNFSKLVDLVFSCSPGFQAYRYVFSGWCFVSFILVSLNRGHSLRKVEVEGWHA